MLEARSLLVGARAADLYAGTGTQGLEALSRGAEHCLFVERRADAVQLLHENLAKTGLAARAEVRCAAVGAVLQEWARAGETAARFDLILDDPPFAFSRAPESRAALEAEMALAGRFLHPGHARLVLRFEKKVQPPAPPGLALVRHWTDGPHAFAFYGQSTAAFAGTLPSCPPLTQENA